MNDSDKETAQGKKKGRIGYEERQQILEKRSAGMSVQAIADAHNRNYGTVAWILKPKKEDAQQPPTKKHERVCFNCQKTDTMPEEWAVCCWNPTGCGCTPQGYAS